MQNFYGWYSDVVIIFFQIISFTYTINFLTAVPWKISQISDPLVRDSFWLMRGLANNYKLIIFADSVAVFLSAVKIIFLIRNKSALLDKMLTNLQSGAGMYTFFVLVWAGSIFGVACFSMSIYGTSDHHFSNPLSAFTNTLHQPIVLDRDIGTPRT